MDTILHRNDFLIFFGGKNIKFFDVKGEKNETEISIARYSVDLELSFGSFL